MSNNLQAKDSTSTTAYFNTYYTQGKNVSGQEYDIVMAFFLKQTKGNKIAAESLTASVFTIASNKNVKALSLLEELKNINNSNDIKTILISLINSDRPLTSKLGFKKEAVVSETIHRNIISG